MCGSVVQARPFGVSGVAAVVPCEQKKWCAAVLVHGNAGACWECIR